MIHEALRLLDERDYLQNRRLEALAKDIAAGIEQADNGDLIDGKTVFDALRQKMLTEYLSKFFVLFRPTK